MSLILALDALHITFTHLTPISSVNCIHHTPDLGSTAASTLVHSWTTSVLPALVILISVFFHYFVWQHFFLNFASIHEAYTLHCQQLLAVTVLHFTNIWESKRWKRKPKDNCTWDQFVNATKASFQAIQKGYSEIQPTNCLFAAPEVRVHTEMKWKVVVLVFIHFQIKP